ncbi:hypothetical protein ACIA8G_35070 [Lentzea sp. NPDC051213]|uniref:hypothetical protein n=1 Tax=Lentzea sp. NPDC051213 TaxID=3364126 RepID=UPI00378FA017
MDVEQLLAANAATVDQQMRSIDLDAGLQRVFAALDALDGPEPSFSQPARLADLPEVSRAPAPHSAQAPEWAVRELSLRESEVQEKETAWNCRRIAELKEVLNKPDEAAAWWRRAANAGDLDAQDYVETYLS